MKWKALAPGILPSPRALVRARQTRKPAWMPRRTGSCGLTAWAPESTPHVVTNGFPSPNPSGPSARNLINETWPFVLLPAQSNRLTGPAKADLFWKSNLVRPLGTLRRNPKLRQGTGRAEGTHQPWHHRALVFDSTRNNGSPG